MSALPKLTPQQQLEWLLGQSIDDPEFFIVHVLRPKLGARWKWQRKVCEEIRKQLRRGDRSMVRVLIRSCHGAGKTWLAAAFVLWWTFTRPRSRVLTLAQSWHGVEKLIWPNIATLFSGSLLRGSDQVEMLHTSITLDRPPEGGESEWYAVGASTDKPGRLEGHHSPIAAMRVVDEAKEVDEGIFEATEGMLDAPENFDLWISTPSISAGPFYERDMGLEKGSASVLRTVIDVDQLIADGVEEKRDWKQRRLEAWGKDSARYQCRVMARYASNAAGQLFPSSWVEAAMAQTFEVAGPVVAGLDVAGSEEDEGDENAIAIVAGPDRSSERTHVRYVDSWSEEDTMLTKGKALAAMKAHGATVLRVDAIGIGKGVVDAVRHDDEAKVSVSTYKASNSARDAERYFNRKAEDCWRLRDMLETQTMIRLPNHPKLKSQLTAMRFKELPNGKVRIIDPPNSPDLADAVIIACAGVRAGSGHAPPEVDDEIERYVSVSDLAAF